MGRSLLNNIIHLFYSTILANLLQAVSLIALANFFNAQHYGMFSVAIAVTFVMLFFTDLGLSNTFLREGAKDGVDIRTILSSYIKIRMVLLTCITIIGYIVIHYVYEDRNLIYMMINVMFLMLVGLTWQNIGIAYFQLTEHMKYIALIKVVSASVVIIITCFCIFGDLPVYVTARLYGFGYLIGGIFSIYVMKRKTNISMNIVIHKALFWQLTPFIVSGFLIMSTPQLAPILLNYTLPLSMVGIFAVAYRMPAALYQVPGVIAGAFFPVLFKHYNQNNLEEHTKLNLLQIKSMTIVGICMTIGLYNLAPYFISIFFHEEWSSAVEPLQILSFLIVLQSLNIAIADGLTTSGCQNKRTAVQCIALVIGGIMLYSFSSIGGVIGAAYAMVLFEIVALVGYIAVSVVKKKIVFQIVIPYTIYFGVTFIGVQYILRTYNLIALVLHTLIVVVGILLYDHELKNLLLSFVRKTRKKDFITKQGI
ncbi:sugar translocase [Bacillus cereus]|uniref:Sugar translocase n=1 Tax=Bacillus cereus TaxID=1396 RepID=A0A2B2GI46_BACCE|nr:MULTISPECIES: oligosaccharide flippase family protein [Bacillus cereus group]MDR4985350.1 oligosaccharide flippase family protein [Bacillus cereus]MEA1009484.1 oligosaccharide flippase family protein [Bacillus cereus]PES97085.1 sugar translocase [Bacillus cereus]PFP80781.1 sugar translocase [Bacillus cereus]PGT20255.1 sugar translocase [Bacillus cereus]